MAYKWVIDEGDEDWYDENDPGVFRRKERLHKRFAQPVRDNKYDALFLEDDDPLLPLLSDGILNRRTDKVKKSVTDLCMKYRELPDDDDIRYVQPQSYDYNSVEGSVVPVKLLKHQKAFVDDVETPYLGLVAGYGSGKTDAFVYKAIHLAALNAGFMKPDQYNVLLEPTGIMVRTLLMPRLERILEEKGIPYDVTKSPVPSYTLKFAAGPVTINLLSAQNTDRLVGFECAFFGVDEADTLTRETMTTAWEKLQGRMRAGLVRQGFTTSTPEGYNFLYKYFVKDAVEEDGTPKKDRRLIRGSTYDNPYLPESYIPNLEKQYPSQLLRAYLHGEFVNLLGGNVYYSFDRNYNDTNITLDQLDAMNEKMKKRPYAIHLGIDFNVNAMSVTVGVIVNGLPVIVDELIGGKNTASVIKEITDRYGKDRDIYVYADKSGAAQKTSASESDLTQLKNAGFILQPNGNNQQKNPAVKSRVDAVNAMFCNSAEQRRLTINTDKCPVLTECIETQPYDPRTNAPFKDGKVDGPPDALGYFIESLYPIKRASFVQAELVA